MKNKLEALFNTFEVKTRTNGEKTRTNGENFVCQKDDTSEELQDACRDIHGTDFLPDDFRYNAISNLCCRMLDYEIKTVDDLREYEAEIIDSQVDISTYNLTQWLGSHNLRPSYCDEAMEMGMNMDSVMSIIGCGQYLELQELFNGIVSYLG